jgi:hypothetical protein
VRELDWRFKEVKLPMVRRPDGRVFKPASDMSIDIMFVSEVNSGTVPLKGLDPALNNWRRVN